jgi:hypothetical protein
MPSHPSEKVVFKSFVGCDKHVNFARFFVLNAKVLDKIEFEGYYDYNSESVACQHKVLQVENRASRDVQIELSVNTFVLILTSICMICQWPTRSDNYRESCCLKIALFCPHFVEC